MRRAESYWRASRKQTAASRTSLHRDVQSVVVIAVRVMTRPAVVRRVVRRWSREAPRLPGALQLAAAEPVAATIVMDVAGTKIAATRAAVVAKRAVIQIAADHDGLTDC
jgi:hypothetical protein